MELIKIPKNIKIPKQVIPAHSAEGYLGVLVPGATSKEINQLATLATHLKCSLGGLLEMGASDQPELKALRAKSMETLKETTLAAALYRRESKDGAPSQTGTGYLECSMGNSVALAACFLLASGIPLDVSSRIYLHFAMTVEGKLSRRRFSENNKHWAPTTADLTAIYRAAWHQLSRDASTGRIPGLSQADVDCIRDAMGPRLAAELDAHEARTHPAEPAADDEEDAAPAQLHQRRIKHEPVSEPELEADDFHVYAVTQAKTLKE